MEIWGLIFVNIPKKAMAAKLYFVVEYLDFFLELGVSSIVYICLCVRYCCNCVLIYCLS